jgi:hypothetical protein
MAGDHGANDELREMPIAVVEQLVSNLVQGSLCLVLLTEPFLHLLNLAPQGEYAVSFVAPAAHLTLCALLSRDCGPIVRDGFVDRR